MILTLDAYGGNSNTFLSLYHILIRLHSILPSWFTHGDFSIVIFTLSELLSHLELRQSINPSNLLCYVIYNENSKTKSIGLSRAQKKKLNYCFPMLTDMSAWFHIWNIQNIQTQMLICYNRIICHKHINYIDELQRSSCYFLLLSSCCRLMFFLFEYSLGCPFP